MTKQAFIYLLLLLVGAAGGTGLGYLLTQAKIDEANMVVDELKGELTTQSAQAEESLKTINTKVSRLEAELTRARNDLMRKNTELLRAQTDMEKLKTLVQQTLNRQGGGGTETAAAGAATATTPTRTPAPVRTTPLPGGGSTASTPSASTGAGRAYTIKDGDSLWKIAANELGNGTRYHEIIALNPGMTESSTLTVGSTIRIPVR